MRKLKARMALKGLSLKDVSDLSGVNYSYCSLILSGIRNNPDELKKIKAAIRNAPMPEEAAA